MQLAGDPHPFLLRGEATSVRRGGGRLAHPREPRARELPGPDRRQQQDHLAERAHGDQRVVGQHELGDRQHDRAGGGCERPGAGPADRGRDDGEQERQQGDRRDRYQQQGADGGRSHHRHGGTGVAAQQHEREAAEHHASEIGAAIAGLRWTVAAATISSATSTTATGTVSRRRAR